MHMITRMTMWNSSIVAQGELVFLKIAVNFLLDGITDAVLEEIQSFLALGSDGQVGPVADRLGGDHSGIRQFIDDLLQGQEVRVFLSKDKIADLCGRERESHTVQHVENDKFI